MSLVVMVVMVVGPTDQSTISSSTSNPPNNPPPTPRNNRRIYRDSLLTQLEETDRQLTLSKHKLSLLTELNELRSFQPQDITQQEHQQENMDIDTLYQTLVHSRQEVQVANSLIMFRGIPARVRKTLSVYIKHRQSCLTVLAFWHQDGTLSLNDLYSNHS